MLDNFLKTFTSTFRYTNPQASVAASRPQDSVAASRPQASVAASRPQASVAASRFQDDTFKKPYTKTEETRARSRERTRIEKKTDSRPQSRSPVRQSRIVSPSPTASPTASRMKVSQSPRPQSTGRSQSSRQSQSPMVVSSRPYSQDREPISREKYFPEDRVLYNTPFSYGLEYEPSSLHYYDHLQRSHYDRETIFPLTYEEKKENPNLKVTIEEFDRDKFDDDEKKYSCEYNIEIDMGPFVGYTIGGFLESIQNRKSRNSYIDGTIKPVLDNFIKYIQKDNTEYLRLMKRGQFDGNKNYQKCDMSIEQGKRGYRKDIEVFYKELGSKENILNVTGRPQMTIGMSYAFLPYLASYYANIPNYAQKIKNILIKYDSFIESNQELFTGIRDDSRDVFKGFIFLILYISTIRTNYVSKYAGGTSSYLKTQFPIKPRTNLAVSYINLKQTYPDLENKFIQFTTTIDDKLESIRQELNSIFGINIERFNYKGIKASTEKDEQPTETSIVSHKLDVLRNIAQKNGDIKSFMKNSKIYTDGKDDNNTVHLMYRIQYITGEIKRINIPELIKIITYFEYLDSYTLLYDMLNPVRVVKVKILDKTKLNKSICEADDYKQAKILDGYLYSYIEGKDKEYIDTLVSENLIEIEGPFIYSGQPPLLFPVKKYARTYICTNFRQELLEWIPMDSNIIVELRGPEKLTTSDKFDYTSSIKLSDLREFYEEVFNGLYNALSSPYS